MSYQKITTTGIRYSVGKSKESTYAEGKMRLGGKPFANVNDDGRGEVTLEVTDQELFDRAASQAGSEDKLKTRFQTAVKDHRLKRNEQSVTCRNGGVPKEKIVEPKKAKAKKSKKQSVDSFDVVSEGEVSSEAAEVVERMDHAA